MLLRVRRWCSLSLLLALLVATTSCAGGAGESSDPTKSCSPEDLAVGDYVRVTTTDGSTHEFEVDSISSMSIAGGETRVRIDDIEDLQILKATRRGPDSNAPPPGVWYFVGFLAGLIIGLIQLSAMD